MARVSYKKLWKLLIDRDMKKKDLREATGISSASMAKLGKNENVTTDVLVRICDASYGAFYPFKQAVGRTRKITGFRP